MLQLAGASMARLVSAIPLIAETTGSPVIVVGGLSVICRLGTPYRATTDLDTVDVQTADSRPHLELLLVKGPASGPAGTLLPTPLGHVQVDVLAVSPADQDPLPDDETDRLHVLSHLWAAETATALTLAVDGAEPVTVAVAEPGPIIAMKLQAVMNRPAAKEGTDLLDILRLTLDAPADQRLVISSRVPATSCAPMPFFTPSGGSASRLVPLSGRCEQFQKERMSTPTMSSSLPTSCAGH